MTRGRDGHGKFIKIDDEEEVISVDDDDIVDAEVIEDEPGTELAVIPEPSALPDDLIREALGYSVVKPFLFGTSQHRIMAALHTIGILFPEMVTQSVGKAISFDWPECPTYADLPEWPVY